MKLRQQSGFTLIELIMVIGLLAVATVLSVLEKQTELDQMQAKATGKLMAEYNQAVSAWISNNPSSITSTGTTIEKGSLWLKPTTCGGPNAADNYYLPCHFPALTESDPYKFGGLSVESTIVRSPSEVTVTTNTSAFKMQNEIRPDYAGLAAITAAGTTTIGGSGLPISSGSFTSSPITGEVTMVSTSAAPADTWLRVDGLNTMNGHIVFDPTIAAGDRQILNVSLLKGIAGEMLQLGENGQSIRISPAGVVVEPDQRILKTLVVSNSAGATDAVRVSAGNLVLDSGDVVARRLVDNDNNSFLVDPSGESVVSTATATGRIRALNFEPTANVAANAGCPINGMIAKSADGMMTCYKGTWRTPSMFYTMSVSSGASCTAQGRGSFAIGSDGKLYVCK